MMSGRALSPEEVWLQESEARLDSMEVLLKSVRRDIDALSEKIPSPRPSLRKAFREEDPVVHESGSKDYILTIDSRPRGYQNLGLGSHTTLEPFDDEDDIDRSNNDVPFQKPWRSPSDFRATDSPRGSPTFGESSNIISLHDVILHTECSLPASQEELERDRRITQMDSLHSLPTIEENSQEDNTDTSLSISDDLKSADCSYGYLAEPAVSGKASGSSQPSLNKSRPQSPFIIDHEALRYSRNSLKSRESMQSETDSFVTVNSQLFPSVEEAYITACSDADELDESNDEEPSLREKRSTWKKVLVLRQTPSADGETDSEDVLEFTFVEATSCKTSNKENNSLFSEEPGKSGDISDDLEKKPIKRRALRRKKTEEISKEEEEEDADTSSSSTCEEAIYDTNTATTNTNTAINSNAIFCYEKSPVVPRPNPLCSIDETSYLSNRLDSPTGNEDNVIPYEGSELNLQLEEVSGNNSVGIAESISIPLPLPEIDIATPRDGEEVNEIAEIAERSDVPRSDTNRLYSFGNEKQIHSATAEDEIGAELMVTTSLNITQPVSCHYNNCRQVTEPASFVPRVDLPQRHTDYYNHRARRDYFSIPRSSDTSFVGNTDDGSSSHLKPLERNSSDFQQKPTHRSKSVSRPNVIDNDSFQYRIVSAGIHEARIDATTGRMYSRSCSRYRSTDMDVALANTTVSRENLSNASLNEAPRKKKMALSLFDLSTRQTTNLSTINGKSTNSLLETDIDTGEQKSQQIVLETDVDTLNTCRLVGGLTAANQGPSQLTSDKAYSLFNLTYANNTAQINRYNQDGCKHESRAEAYKRAQSLSGIAKTGEDQRSDTKSGTSGLVARLRARARSNHELRIAESLTRIHVPEWLDKADLSKPIAPMYRSSSASQPGANAALPRNGIPLTSSAVIQRPFIHFSSKTVETVSKPTFSLTSSSRPESRHPLRPSQILRERNASSGPRLVPIKSSLTGSMKSQIKSGGEILPSVIRSGLRSSSSHSVHLAPEDFLTRNEKVWGEIPDIPPPLSYAVAASAELIQAPKSRFNPQSSSSSLFSQSKPSQTRQSSPVKESHLPSTQDCSDSIGMVDSDSIVDNQFYQPLEASLDKQTSNGRVDDESIYEEVQRPTKFAPPPLSIPQSSPTNSFSNNICLSSNAHSPSWHNADSDGETETVATDGLDNISDLTSLTDLLDKYSSRHLNLLQNRPSALESILTQFGWSSGRFNNVSSRHQLRGSGDYVALAAGLFDPEEDSHRNEFLALLSSPAAQGPLILTEYGFDQKRIGMDRNPKDGMLYLRCNNPSCPRMGPTRVDRASSWRTCTNCFTTYCSSKCREQAQTMHNMVCNFGRVRLVCGRILHSLAPSQQASLTALAKAGATRLGRGGILITFASVQDAELFLARCVEQIRLHPGVASANRPNPSGLIAPPIYLTIDELNKLDSKLSTLCRIYKPSVSYVLIVIICAYDLEMTKNGRAVHLYKQCIILPFPMATRVVQPGVAFASLQGGPPHEKNSKVPGMQSQTTKEEREAYSKRLQRTLRERGISLRNNEPEIYKRLSAFVETGENFEPIEFDFHDYYSNQVIACTLVPMKDVIIRTKADFEKNAFNEETQQSKICSKTKFYKMTRSRFGETEL